MGDVTACIPTERSACQRRIAQEQTVHRARDMNHTTLSLMVCLLSLTGGCVVDATPSGVAVRNAYEACNAGDACTNGTSCTTAMYTASGRAGNFCSAGCTNAVQCPPSAYAGAYAPTCIVSVSAGAGLCYDTCVGNGDCGGATVCAQVPGTTVRVCVPAT